MPLSLVVDGYNLLLASPEMFPGADLQESREELLDLLARYKKIKGFSVTVVFDAARAAGGPGRKSSEKGLSVRYSALGQSADSAIRDLCGKLRQKALVVTSDRALARDVQALGAASISSQEFLNRVMAGLYASADAEDEPEPARRDKKGPAKRQKKSRRRQERKSGKL